jgi:MFS family permease
LIFSLIIGLILSPSLGIAALYSNSIMLEPPSDELLTNAPMIELLFNDTTSLVYGSISGLIYAAIGGLWVGILGKIKTVEMLKWSWREAAKSFRRGLIVALIISLFAGVLFGMFTGLSQGVFIGVLFGLVMGLLFGLVMGLIGGFRGPEIQQSNVPNQGIWKSAKNALLVGLSASLALGLSSGFLFGMIYGLTLGLVTGLFYMIVGMLVGVLACGGLSCFRHFILRFLLYRLNYTPWNYARFLDNAANHLFMQKVGGGYIFVHRMLMEHFAKMELKQGQH